MQKFLIVCLLAWASAACKKEDPAVGMAKDVCACIMPIVESGDKANEILQRGNQNEVAALEAEMEMNNKKTAECFKNLEKKYGNMESFQSRIMAEMQKQCPRAAALISGGQQ